MSKKEVVTLNIGQTGTNFGDVVWKQYNIEHNIDQHGIQQTKPDDNTVLNFYNETQAGNYRPRTLMIDTDPETINQLKKSHHSSFYDHEYLISGNENAANNFARGYLQIGPEIINEITDKLRSMIETFDNLDGFIINHSVGGGTGSGLTALILDNISSDYEKKIKITFPIYPFYQHHSRSNCVVEPYNALLNMHVSLDKTQISVVFDNAKIYNLCENKLNISLPSYNDMNLLMAKIESSLTSPVRFKYAEGMNHGLNWYGDESQLSGYQTTLIPFPRLHFVIPVLAPLFDNNYDCIYLSNCGDKGKLLIDGFVRLYHESNYLTSSVKHFESPLYKDVMNLIYKSCGNHKEFKDILHDVINNDYFMVDINDFDTQQDKYMQIVLNCHGFTNAKEINANVNAVRYPIQKVTFCEWATCCFHISMDDRSMMVLPDDSIASTEVSTVMFGNNTSISRYFQRTISESYDKLHHLRRATK